MTTAPPHAARATRENGRQTRAALLDAASGLFGARGLSGVSVAEIADAADCFPSQVRYYFGDKEGLFVESACREMLAVRARVETAARRARTPATAIRAMIGAALASDGIPGFVEAMLLARRRQDLAPRIQETFDALHDEAERAATIVLSRHHWETPASPAAHSRAFWSAIIGLALERAAIGAAFDLSQAESVVRAVFGLED